MEYCFIEFKVDDKNRFKDLCRVFEEIKKDKDADSFRNEQQWLAFFDDDARSHFWQPTQEEYNDWLLRWYATPVEQRWTDPSLKTPWDFNSMFDAFQAGDYNLIACRMISSDLARIEFDPYGYPYGGTGCMKALIESFGFSIIAEDDGTGYRKYVESR